MAKQDDVELTRVGSNVKQAKVDQVTEIEDITKSNEVAEIEDNAKSSNSVKEVMKTCLTGVGAAPESDITENEKYLKPESVEINKDDTESVEVSKDNVLEKNYRRSVCRDVSGVGDV